MNEFLSKVMEICTNFGGKLVLAIVVLIIGSLLIKGIKKAMGKLERFSKLEKTVQSFIKSLITIVLYALLIITVIGILGIPMASVVAVLASCGLALGLSLQGALSNFAGGLMILIFKPFRVGDYIEATGAEGTVRDISIFYTSIITLDNKRITVPNGDLMNNNVTNYSCEATRRIDVDFKITNDIDAEFVKKVLLKAAEETRGVNAEPAAFVRLTAVDDDTYFFSVRVWCVSQTYWDVRYDLIENCCKALADNGIDDPEERIAVRIVKENQED